MNAKSNTGKTNIKKVTAVDPRTRVGMAWGCMPKATGNCPQVERGPGYRCKPLFVVPCILSRTKVLGAAAIYQSEGRTVFIISDTSINEDVRRDAAIAYAHRLNTHTEALRHARAVRWIPIASGVTVKQVATLAANEVKLARKEDETIELESVLIIAWQVAETSVIDGTLTEITQAICEEALIFPAFEEKQRSDQSLIEDSDDDDEGEKWKKA